MVGRQLPLFSVMVPFWLIWAFAGWRAMKEIWPAALVCGVSFGLTQFLISNYITFTLAAIGAAVVCMVVLRGFLYVWQPATIWTRPRSASETIPPPPCPRLSRWAPRPARPKSRRPGCLGSSSLRDPRRLGFCRREECARRIFAPAFPVDGLHLMVQRVPPVVAMPAPEAAIFRFTFLSIAVRRYCSPRSSPVS
jgi:lactate permease